jgi:hypothetical protein
VATRRTRVRATSPHDVFLNFPFDRQHERLFIAAIGTLVTLGLNPRCVLEIPPQEDRVRRLFQIVRGCAFSLHDLSRVNVATAGAFRVPRFNMPFELGLAVAHSLSAGHRSTTQCHQWRILEARRFRLNASLSDIAGYDPYIHGGTVRGMLLALQDIFAEVTPRRVTLDDLRWIYLRLREFQARNLGGGVFRTTSFRQLVVTSGLLATERTSRSRP